MRVLLLYLFSVLASVAQAAEPTTVPLGSKVHVQASGIAAGWHTGVLKKGGECTMVFLDQATPEGYTSLALNALRALEVAKGTTWTKVEIRPLLAKESKDCREAAAD